MRKLFALALLLLAACSPAALPQRVSVYDTPAATPRIQASPVASETTQPTDAGTATPDYQATTNAAQATSDASKLEAAQINATASAESVQATQGAYLLNLTADAESRSAGMTQQAARYAADALQATRTQDGAVMAARAPTIIAAMTQATYTGAYQFAGLGMQWALIIVLVGIGGLFAAIGYQRFTRPQPIDYNYALGNPATAGPLPPLERAVIPLPGGGLDLDTVPPGDLAKFTEFCRYALEGKPLGIGAVVAAGIYGSNAQYAPVSRWMHKKGYFAPQQATGAIGLSASGQWFCEVWVKDHPEEAK